MKNSLASHLCRRTFLRQGSYGIGATALAAMLEPNMASGEDTGIEVPQWNGVYPRKEGDGKIKRVIHLCMAGGPSHLETLDPKPELGKMDGKPIFHISLGAPQLICIQLERLKANLRHGRNPCCRD